LIAACLLINHLGVSEFHKIHELVSTPDFDGKVLYVPIIMFLVACICKSAQFPFSYWLVSSTVANTFASVFMHAATVLGVGVIFMIKLSFIIDLSTGVKSSINFIALTSSLIMSLCSIAHNDVKKSIACSSSSYVGLMFVACGLSCGSIAILSFVTHAFFKSLIFLGYVYSVYGAVSSQEVKRIVAVSVLSSIGIPFVISFFSKHELTMLVLGSGSLISIQFFVISILLIISSLRIASNIIRCASQDGELQNLHEHQKAESRIEELRVEVKRAGVCRRFKGAFSSELQSLCGLRKLQKSLAFWIFLLSAIFFSWFFWWIIRGKSTHGSSFPHDFWHGCIIEFAQIIVALTVFFACGKKSCLLGSFMIEKIQATLSEHKLSEFMVRCLRIGFFKVILKLRKVDALANWMFDGFFRMRMAKFSKNICLKHKFSFSGNVLFYSSIVAILQLFWPLLNGFFLN
jgi:NADH:ubiquinone oxidoreductase subunit 5 (subunit L)/multisubunit Na+/H+ antiporter MnhA subunit